MQSFDPPVGAVYRITCSVRKGDLLLRLPGLRKHCGTFRFRLLPTDDPEGHFMEYASGAYVEKKCCRVSLSDVSIEVARVIASLLADPPTDGLYVHSEPALVPLRPMGMVGLPIALGSSRLPSRSLHDILYDNLREPALSLSEGKYAYRAILAWGVPILSTTTCIVYGTAENILRAHHRVLHPELPKARLMQLVRSTLLPVSVGERIVRGSRGLLPTIPVSSVYHPILLSRPMRYLSLYSLLELFGIPHDDPLAEYLIREGEVGQAGCRRALSTLLQGLSGHTVHSLLASIRAKSPISDVPHWLVATSFSGGDTFSCHLRRFGHPFTLVAASEPEAHHRSAHAANHPGLARFPSCVSHPSVTTEMPFHHLRVGGFPCEDFSNLKRGVTRAQLLYSLKRFDWFVDSLRHMPPLVVLLENVASLLSSRLEWVANHIEHALHGLAGGRYLIFRDILCSSSFGSCYTRPRVIWLMYLY